MRSKSQAFYWSLLLISHVLRDSIKSQIYFSHKFTPLSSLSSYTSTVLTFPFLGKAYYSTASATDSDSDSDSDFVPSTLVQDLLAEVEKDRLRERQQRIRAGLDPKDIDAETEEDYMGIGPLIEKFQKQKLTDSLELNKYEEPTDSILMMMMRDLSQWQSNRGLTTWRGSSRSMKSYLKTSPMLGYWRIDESPESSRRKR